MTSAIDELRAALDDPRWTQELYLIAAALIELADRIPAKEDNDAPS